MARNSFLPLPERHERFIAVQLIAFVILEGVFFFSRGVGSRQVLDAPEWSYRGGEMGREAEETKAGACY